MKIEIQETESDVLEKAFTAMYWLAKEDVANKKIFSLLRMLEGLGFVELKHFKYKSTGSVREIFLTLGKKVAEQIEHKVAGEAYGLLIDDAADVSNTEQMLTFIILILIGKK